MVCLGRPTHRWRVAGGGACALWARVSGVAVRPTQDGEKVSVGAGCLRQPSRGRRGGGQLFQPKLSGWGFLTRGFRRAGRRTKAVGDLCPVGQGFRGGCVDRLRMAEKGVP